VKVVGVFTLVLLLVDLNRDGERCEQECYGTYRTYEPGHAWTNYPDSWQWDAQNALAAPAFISVVVALLYLIPTRLPGRLDGARRRRRRGQGARDLLPDHGLRRDGLRPRRRQHVLPSRRDLRGRPRYRLG